MAFVRALALAAVVVKASEQGLYGVLSGNGQLQRMDWISGEVLPMGPPLAEQGWIVDACSPSSVHTTYKWYFTLARANTSASGTPWVLIRIRLIDGLVDLAQALPESFAPSLQACDHALSVDDQGFAIYVSAVTQDSEPQLVVSHLDWGRNSSATILSEKLTTIGLGGAVSVPSSILDPYSQHLWFQLQRGLVAINRTGGSVDSAFNVALEIGTSLSGLGVYREDDRIYGVLMREGKAPVFASFSRSTPQPKLDLGTMTVPEPAHSGSAAVICWQEHVVAIASGTALTILDLDGKVVNSTKACGAESSKDSGCFSNLGYQPNVIEAMSV